MKGALARAMQKVIPADQPNSDDEYPEYDDLALDDIDESKLPPAELPVTSPPEPSRGKRARDEAPKAGTGKLEEVTDSEDERRVQVKAVKKQRVQCPSCRHQFNP
jgi:molybdopterin/thiamine biosynthesis adenylyltransferase